jgi:hypothetical protein
MRHTLQKHFAAIGAHLEVRPGPDSVDYRFDIIRDRRSEYFELRGSRLDDLVVQHVDRHARHILVCGVAGHGPRDTRDQEDNNERIIQQPLKSGAQQKQQKPPVSRFLCGHDERHWFVAGIADPAATVRDAKLSLAPAAIREAVARERHRDRRHNGVFIRQGEWFFVPSIPPAVDARTPIHRHEPIRRGRGKPHFCEEVIRHGGVTVRLYQGRELGDAEFAALIAKNPKLPYRQMVRDAAVYARGRVRHDDHATIVLHGWHRVYLNGEFFTQHVVFYD